LLYALHRTGSQGRGVLWVIKWGLAWRGGDRRQLGGVPGRIGGPVNKGADRSAGVTWEPRVASADSHRAARSTARLGPYLWNGVNPVL